MSDAERVTTPWRRDPRAVEAGLAAWASSWRGTNAEVNNVRMPGSGMANDTVLFDVDGEALVARLAPAADSHYPTFPTFDLAWQARIMALVRERTEVPAPEVVHLESSPAWLDVPFMVTRAIEGEVASDNPPYLADPNGWFLHGTPADWQRLETSTLDVFAQLHCIVDGVDTEFLRVDAPGDTALARLLASHRDYYEWARDGHTVPALEHAYDLLAKALPHTERSVLLWGDGRPGNIIYRDFEPAGVLDWEMAGVGPPEADIAWATFFHRFWARMAEPFGVSVPAMFGRDESAATYERLSGTALDDLAWYEALAGYRFGIILMRMGLRSVAYGQQQMPRDVNDLMMFPALLEDLLTEI